ncbi:MAG: extracellular solute-binding protein, partial [Lachnospiraceae bacterium]|nr:extracellular solute-binding protein [Lachnospiraceae bacterium]
MQVMGDALYYSSGSWNEDTQNYEQYIKKYSLTDKTTQELMIPLETNENTEDGSYSGQNIHGFVALEEGVGVVLNTYKSSANGEYESWDSFVKLDASGNEIFNTDLREVMGNDEENSYIRNILADAEGNFYLVADRKVFLIDAEGKSCGAADLNMGTDSWVNAAGVGKNGKVYVGCFDYSTGESKYILSEIDFASRKVSNTYENFRSSNGERIYAGAEKDFVIHDGSTVYEYDLEKQTCEAAFDWLDSDINGSFVNMVGALSDGRVIAAYEDWSTDERGIALLTKTPAKNVVQKKQILIGTMFTDSDLQAAAVKFNRSNDEYRISIKQYVDYDNYSENTWSDALTTLNNDLTSKNCPDIVNLSNLNPERLASKGIFEDLASYLDKSEKLSKEDYLENVMEAFTFDGKLVCIPKSFEMMTIAGRASDLGTESGWTLSELAAYANANPDASLFEGMTQEIMLQIFMTYNEDLFIDWESGKCSFDSQEFKELLELAARFPKEYEWSADDASEPTKIQNGEVLLSYTYIYNFDEVQLYNEIYEGDLVFIGFPSADGTGGHLLQTSAGYAITKKSDVKDGAWEFIESYLTSEQSDYDYGFSTNKNELAKMAEEACKVEYATDENGAVIKDENGEPIPVGGGYGIGYEDGWE